MAAIPFGLLAAALLPGARRPHRAHPAAYASAYFLLALPNAFVAVALMFSAATRGRRGVASCLGGAFVFSAAVVSWQFVAALLGHWGLAKLTDPLGLTLIGEMSKVWTPDELRYLLVDLFEANTYWEFAAKRVEAERVGTGEWRVTLDVRARKLVVNEEGVETEVPMDERRRAVSVYSE